MKNIKHIDILIFLVLIILSLFLDLNGCFNFGAFTLPEWLTTAIFVLLWLAGMIVSVRQIINRKFVLRSWLFVLVYILWIIPLFA